jgi:hypothetical protein
MQMKDLMINTASKKMTDSRFRDMYHSEKANHPKSSDIAIMNAYVVTADRIFIEDDFNIRKINDEHVDMFKNAYINNELVPRIIVKVVKDENGDYYCLVREGHHRFIGGVQAGKTEFEVDEFIGDKVCEIALMINTANGLPLTMLDMAEGIKRLKDEGQNNSQIGRLINKSSAHVGHLIELLLLPERLKKMIENEQISATYARELYKEHGKDVFRFIFSNENITNENPKVGNLKLEIHSDVSGQDEAVQAEAMQDEAGQAEAMQDEAGQAEAMQDEAGQAEAMQDEAGQAEAMQDEAGQAEAMQDEAGQDINHKHKITKKRLGNPSSIPKSIIIDVKSLIIEIAEKIKSKESQESIEIESSQFEKILNLATIMERGN